MMRHDYPDPVELRVNGFCVLVDDHLGHLAVEHDGAITWDELQAIKNHVWGEEANAIEIYPAQDKVINTRPMRHLWRLGADDFCPDLLGRYDPPRTLEARFKLAWEGC